MISEHEDDQNSALSKGWIEAKQPNLSMQHVFSVAHQCIQKWLEIPLVISQQSHVL